MNNNVQVFKTSINRKDISRIKLLLDSLISKDDTWNVDLEDCDNILRVKSISTQPVEIIRTLQLAGFACEELED